MERKWKRKSDLIPITQLSMHRKNERDSVDEINRIVLETKHEDTKKLELKPIVLMDFLIRHSLLVFKYFQIYANNLILTIFLF